MFDFLKDAFDFVAKPVTEVVKFVGDGASVVSNLINGDQAGAERNKAEVIAAQLKAEQERSMRLEMQATNGYKPVSASAAIVASDNGHGEGLPKWFLPAAGVAVGALLLVVVIKGMK